jgi:hypothetical protein
LPSRPGLIPPGTQLAQPRPVLRQRRIGRGHRSFMALAGFGKRRVRALGQLDNSHIRRMHPDG